MVNEYPINLMAIFPSRQLLLDAIEKLSTIRSLQINRAAVVARTQKGKIVFIPHSITDKTAAKLGRNLGSTLGAIGGIIQMGGIAAIPGIGPVIALGTGVLLGGFVGKQTGRVASLLIEYNYSPAQIQEIAQDMQNGQAALLVEVDSDAYNLLVESLQHPEAQFRLYQDAVYH